MDIGLTETITVLGTTFLITYIYIKWIYGFWGRKNVASIKPSFPMGNLEMPWNVRKGYHVVMADAYKEFAAKGLKYAGIYSFFRPVLMPIDLELLTNIIVKDFGHFVDRGMYVNEKDDPLSAHLFRIGGDKWRHLRSKLSPTFTSGKMKLMFQTVMDCGNGLEDEVHRQWTKKEPVNVKEISALFTINVIGSCAFGLTCNCFENPENDFRRHTKNAFDGGLLLILRRLAVESFPELCKKLGVRVFDKSVTDFYIEVIRDIINQRETGNIKRQDFVELLLQIKNSAKTKEQSFTFNEIAAQAFVFFLAGFETSSSTMTFAFYEMAKEQEVQDKVREEIRRVIAKHDGQITYNGIMEMTYLSQVFDETLRKYPILATLDRICTKDYKIPGEDLVLKKGTKVWISLMGIQNDPKYFPEPEKFDPDRFLAENKKNIHPCTYMPFGEGPRICIGMRFGIMQAKIGMAMMLKDYKYTLNPKMPQKMKLSTKSALLAPYGEILLDIEKVH